MTLLSCIINRMKEKIKHNMFHNLELFVLKLVTGQLKVLSTNKPVNILCFKGDLLTRNYFCYGQIILFGHKTE